MKQSNRNRQETHKYINDQLVSDSLFYVNSKTNIEYQSGLYIFQHDCKIKKSLKIPIVLSEAASQRTDMTLYNVKKKKDK